MGEKEFKEEERGKEGRREEEEREGRKEGKREKVSICIELNVLKKTMEEAEEERKK